MKSLKVMGIIGIVLVSITMLCAFGNAETETVGVWTMTTLFFALAQSIVGIVQSKNIS